MADKNDVKKALVAAAEAILKRKLSETEINELVRAFNAASGTYHDKAFTALANQSGMTREAMLKEARASTDTDRIMQDLQDTLNDWND